VNMVTALLLALGGGSLLAVINAAFY
jgi:hypothetical protein